MPGGHRPMFKRSSVHTLKLALNRQCYLHGTVQFLCILECFNIFWMLKLRQFTCVYKAHNVNRAESEVLIVSH